MVRKLIFSTKKEAQVVLKYMREMIERYGCVTVRDYYDLCGMRSTYRDSLHGWYELQNIKIEKRECYGLTEWTIELPEARELYTPYKERES